MSIDHRIGLDPLTKRLRRGAVILVAVNLALTGVFLTEAWMLHRASDSARGAIRQAFSAGLHACAAQGKRS